MQVLLAEKDAELQRLGQRIERMEARRGAMDELQQLDALEARLRVCSNPQTACGSVSVDSTVKAAHPTCGLLIWDVFESLCKSLHDTRRHHCASLQVSSASKRVIRKDRKGKVASGILWQPVTLCQAAWNLI